MVKELFLIYSHIVIMKTTGHTTVVLICGSAHTSLRADGVKSDVLLTEPHYHLLHISDFNVVS